MNDKTIETLHALERAESNEEILLAVKQLERQPKNPENTAVVNAAGNILENNLQDE